MDQQPSTDVATKKVKQPSSIEKTWIQTLLSDLSSTLPLALPLDATWVWVWVTAKPKK